FSRIRAARSPSRCAERRSELGLDIGVYARNMSAYTPIVKRRYCDARRHPDEDSAVQLPGAAPGGPAHQPVLRPAPRLDGAADDAVFDPRQAESAGTDEDRRACPRARLGSNR